MFFDSIVSSLNFLTLHKFSNFTRNPVKVAVIDFHDSFTFNLVHYLEEAGAEVIVMKDGSVSNEQLRDVDRIILSPGPGLPAQKINLLTVIDDFHESKPILGVCLGMQGIAAYFGNKLYNLDTVIHGQSSEMVVNSNSPLFRGLPAAFQVARYHSWAVTVSDDSDLKVDGVTDEGIVMSFYHKKYPVYGVQFHPESILTEHGKDIIVNFLKNQ